MRAHAKSLGIFAALATASLFAFVAWTTFRLDWSDIGAIRSPDGRIVASILRSRSESALAPYGEHVVLTPRWRTSTRTMSEPIFAGYCKGGVRVAWIAEGRLSISCNAEPGAPIHKETRWNDVDIEYAIGDAPPT